MVLESLFSLNTVRENPMNIFILSIIGTVVAIIISNFLGLSGLFLTFLITLCLLPIMIKYIRYEESRREYDHFWDYCYSLSFFERHGDLILSYFCMIFGVSLVIAGAFFILPAETNSMIFSDQTKVISQITGNITTGEIFSKILINNLGVMLICFVFSLFYSSGAVLLIAWNASVLGVVVGQTAKTMMSMSAIPLLLFSYMPHGVFEFLGYILAGIAGGLLSIALARHKESKRHFQFILEDSLLLLFLGVIVILIGAGVEVMFI